MKICFIISTMGAGGAERVMSILANSWCSDMKVHIIQFSKNPSFYLLDQKVELHSLNRQSKENNIVSKLYYHISTVSILKNKVKEIDADIYISFISEINVFSILACKLAKKKVIVSEHNNHIANKNRVTKNIISQVYKYSNLVTVLTEFDFEYYRTFLSNVSIIRNPVSFAASDINRIKENKIICVGKLGQQKSFNQIIEAINLVKTQLNGWTIHILGDGPLKKQLENLISRYNLEEIVFLEGQQKNILDWYRKSALFVLCSQYEGFPMVLIEAMSQGCACISYDIISGPNEIIDDSKDGILVPPNDTTRLSEEIVTLINSPKQRNSLGQKARQNIQRLNVENINKVWYKHLKELCSEK